MQLRFKLLLVLSLLSYQSFSYATGQKILLATSEWEPYISETRAGHGKFAEIVTAVFKEMGMTTEFVFAPWKRVEALVKQGDVFAGIPYSDTVERRKVFDYSDPILDSVNVFFYHTQVYPKGVSYSKLEDLSHYRISGVTGYWYENTFAQAKLPVEYVTSDQQSITKLYFKRVDLVATDELVGWSLIKNLYPQDASVFAVVAKPLKLTSLHLLISKKYPNAADITQKFNATFQRLNKQGLLPK
jgi:polar amino acid transport system substrate-binding protein